MAVATPCCPAPVSAMMRVFPTGQERLAQHVVDLVRSRVVEVFAFEDDARLSGVASELGRLGDDRRTARISAAQTVELPPKIRIVLEPLPGGRKVVQSRHERLWHVPSSELAEERPLNGAELLIQLPLPCIE